MPVDELTDRAGRPEVLARDAAADHDYRRRTGSVGRLEVAAVEKAGANGGQIASADRSNQGPEWIGAHLNRRPVGRHECPDHEGFTNEDARASETGGFDTRVRPQSRQNLFDRFDL